MSGHCETCGGSGREMRNLGYGNVTDDPCSMCAPPVASRGHTLDEYTPEALPEHLRWKGKGDPPPYWFANGTKVYRSYADYCDD